MSLPKGYKRLEYIQSSGTQYVDSGFAPKSTSRVVMDVECTESVTSYKAFFGVRNEAMPTATESFNVAVTNATTMRSDFYGTAQAATISTAMARTVIDKNANVTTGYGVTITNTSVSAKESSDTLVLLSLKTEGSGVTNGISAKLYSCQIYDNGTLVRDFIPCQNASGAVGLWDAENEVFYGNAGTGAFTDGPMVPEIVDESEITELEYIQSSGTQFFETGFTPNQDTRVVMDFDLVSVSSEGWASLFAARTNNSATRAFALFSNAAFSSAYEQYASQTLQPKVSLKGRHLVDKNKNVTSLDGAVISTFTYEAFTGDAPLRLLWESSATTQNKYPFIGKLYSNQIYDNGLLERDYIPAMLTNGEVGLYDRANFEFYRNAGTGEFIAGPEAATTPKAPTNFRVESETDALVTLAWDASDKATGYRLYRGGKLIADTTETSVSVTVEPFAGAVFTVTAYNENGEGAGATLTYFNAPDDPILFLVTDRTQQDVTERNPKGYYASSDLNRVGFAVKYLAGRLKDSGVSVTVSPVLTWTDEEWATPAAMTAYLKDVQTMRNALKVEKNTPTAPEDMAKLTYSEANDIETILVALDVHITRMLSIVDAGWASGLAYTGFYAKEAY